MHGSTAAGDHNEGRGSAAEDRDDHHATGAWPSRKVGNSVFGTDSHSAPAPRPGTTAQAMSPRPLLLTLLLALASVAALPAASAQEGEPSQDCPSGLEAELLP